MQWLTLTGGAHIVGAMRAEAAAAKCHGRSAKEAGRPAVLFKVTDPAGTSRFVAIKLIQ